MKEATDAIEENADGNALSLNAVNLTNALNEAGVEVTLDQVKAADIARFQFYTFAQLANKMNKLGYETTEQEVKDNFIGLKESTDINNKQKQELGRTLDFWGRKGNRTKVRWLPVKRTATKGTSGLPLEPNDVAAYIAEYARDRAVSAADLANEMKGKHSVHSHRYSATEAEVKANMDAYFANGGTQVKETENGYVWNGGTQEKTQSVQPEKPKRKPAAKPKAAETKKSKTPKEKLKDGQVTETYKTERGELYMLKHTYPSPIGGGVTDVIIAEAHLNDGIDIF